MMVDCKEWIRINDVTLISAHDSIGNFSNTMNTIGTFTFTTGEPIRLQGFSDGAAISWARDQGIQKQIKDEIEGQFDVFSDDTYPYEDFYKYVEAGFLQGIREAEFVNEAAVNWAGLQAVAVLSAIDRLDLDQDEEKIIASYVNGLKNHPKALTLLTQAGITVQINEKSESTVLGDPGNERNTSRDA